MTGIQNLARANWTVQSRRDFRWAFIVVRALEFGLYGVIVGWPVASVWIAVHVLIDNVMHFFVGKLAADPQGSPGPFAIAYGLQSAVSASIAVPLWLHPGSYGGAVAMIPLTYNVLRAVFESRGTRAVWIGLAPQILFFVAAPLWCWASHVGPLAPPAYWVLGLALVVAAVQWGTEFAEADAKIAAALEQAETRRLQAESATAAKSAFVAMVSHDLRTPIGGVLAAAEELKRRAGDPDAAEAVGQMIAEAGGMMRTLLNDLLDLAKIEAGRMTVETIRFDLAALLDHTCSFHLLQARAKGLDLRLVADPDLPDFIQGDPTRLQQILNNLLSNALKFTSEGEITVTRRLIRDDSGDLMRIEVADTGPGLSPERLKRLFNPYDQTDASVARSHGGTGLGLCISRDLARLMGGDITVCSEEGRGATFIVTFALREAPAEAPSALPPPAPDLLPPMNLRLLIADDHEINRRVLRVLLEPLAPEIHFVEDGEAALDALAQTAFDIILTDLQMPKVGGLELARRIRAQDGPNRATPIIALTGSGQADDVAACLSAGMNGHVTKPMEAGLLFAAMAAVCARQTVDGGRAERRLSAPSMR